MLSGSRATLRALDPATDYPRLTEFANDLDVELAGGGDPPRPHTVASFTEFFDRVSKDGFNFAIEADQKLIGNVGLFSLNRESGTAELGIAIGDKAYWGSGYGREAIELVIDFGFRLQNLRRIWLEVMATNERGIRCYRSVGFTEEGRLREHLWTDGRHVDQVYMALMRVDWLAARP